MNKTSGYVWCGVPAATPDGKQDILYRTATGTPSVVARGAVAARVMSLAILHKYEDAYFLFTLIVHAVFWFMCFLLIVWGNRLPRKILRGAGVFLVVMIILTIYGCTFAIDAVKH
jgi:hypothetical protein